MTIIAKLIAQEAAKFADVRPPRLSVRRLKGGYARYSALSHRIVVSDLLCEHLEPNELKALIAHEVGHAAQRMEILSDGLRLLVPTLAIYVVFAALSLWTYLMGWPVFSGALALTGFALTILWEKWATPRWNQLVQKREGEADAFADQFVGSVGAMARTMDACARLQG